MISRPSSQVSESVLMMRNLLLSWPTLPARTSMRFVLIIKYIPFSHPDQCCHFALQWQTAWALPIYSPLSSCKLVKSKSMWTGSILQVDRTENSKSLKPSKSLKTLIMRCKHKTRKKKHCRRPKKGNTLGQCADQSPMDLQNLPISFNSYSPDPDCWLNDPCNTWF